MSAPEAGGFAVRRTAWPLHRVHGRMPLGDARTWSRAAGPPGERIGWLDTETTGLAGGTGTYVFLIGIAAVEEGWFRLTQYFLAALRAEDAMLRAVADHINGFDAVVTFNGSRFDLPLLETRFLLCRLRRLFAPRAHLDLIALARRLWFRPLGGYSLRQVERDALHVTRTGDVPGWEIPALYVEYLRSGNARPLEPVFAHNAQDLLSLLALHGVAGEALSRPDAADVPLDFGGLGRLLEIRGQAAAAARCYRRALGGEREAGHRWRVICALARLYVARGDLPAALVLWESEAEAGLVPRWRPLERLAMAWEWRWRNARTALEYAERALEVLGAQDEIHRPRLTRRCERLLEKIGASLPRA